MINPDMEKVREVSHAVDRLLGAAILRVVDLGLGSEIVILHEPDAQVVCIGLVPVYRVRVVLEVRAATCAINVFSAPVDGGPYLDTATDGR